MKPAKYFLKHLLEYFRVGLLFVKNVTHESAKFLENEQKKHSNLIAC